MKKIFLTLIITMFSFSAVADVLSDTAITAEVKALLIKESDIPNTNINVSTEKGVVYLAGEVDTRLQENRIVEIASSVNSVSDVNSKNLKVKSSSEFFTDSLITAKVKGRIKYLALNKRISENYNLHVETTDRSVHIFGNVKNENDINTIKETVSSIIDVKEVMLNVICK